MQSPATADPFPMRARTVSSTLAAALAAAALGVAAAGCGSGGASATLDPIAQAAEITNRAGGAQIAMTMSMTIPGLSSPISLTGGGHFNAKSAEGSLAFQMSGLPAGGASGLSGGAIDMTELIKDNVLYMSSPMFDGKLPNGARWMKLDLAKAEAKLGIDPSSFMSGGANPAQILDYLKGTNGSAKLVGHEKVRGVATTRYDGTVDFQSIVDKLPAGERSKAGAAIKALTAKIGNPTFPVSVWIDAHHLLRRMTMNMSFTAEGKSVTANLEVEEFGYGPTPAVTAPPSSETYDASNLSSSAFSSAG